MRQCKWPVTQQLTSDKWHGSGKTYVQLFFSAAFCTSSSSSVLVSERLSQLGHEFTSERTHVTYLSVCQTGSSTPAALICNLTNTLCKCFSVIWMTVVFWELGLVHFLNAYRCNLSICMLSQNAEWVQIAVMKLFHYGDEQCWINKNNKAECFIEPSVEVLWHRVLLCLQLWWLAGGQRWLLAKWNNSNLQLLVIYKQS